MKKYTCNEKDQLLYDLDNPILDCQPDTIWKRILKDIEEYNELMDHKDFLDELPQCPIIQYERPDVIYAKNTSVYVMGIECFKFDSSRKTSNGSTQIRKEIAAEKQIIADYRNGKVMESDGKKYKAVRKKVDVEFSAKEYYKSLIDTYTTHAMSIKAYRENLEGMYSDKQILLSFFIEDITAIGNYVEDNGKTECLNPLKLPLVLELLMNTKGIDYVLVKTTDMYVPTINIQSCDEKNLSKLLCSCYSDTAKFVSYQYVIESHFY